MDRYIEQYPIMSDLSKYSFDSAFRTGKHRYGNAATFYNNDGRLVTSDIHEITIPRVHAVGNPYQQYRDYRPPYPVNGIPNFLSYDPERERKRYARDDYYRRRDAGIVDDLQRAAGDGRERSRERNLRSRSRDDFEWRERGRKRSPERNPSKSPDRYQHARQGLGAVDINRNHKDSGWDRIHDPMTLNKHHLVDPNQLFDDQTTNRRSKSAAQNGDECCGVGSSLNLLFFVDGILLLAFAIANVCLATDYHYYCTFWAGFMVMEFGLISLYHCNQFDRYWKNMGYFLSGAIASVLVFVAIAMVFEKVISDFITLAVVDDYNDYVQMFADDVPNVGKNRSLDDRVWTDLGLDCTISVLFLFDLLILPAILYTFNRYWNAHYRVTRRCEPWCTPSWFNPYGQVALTEALVMSAILTRYGCVAEPGDNRYYEWWSPLWAAVWSLFSALASIVTCKRPEMRNWLCWAVFLLVVAVCTSIAAFVINVVGMAENIILLEDDRSDLSDQFEDRITGSAVLYSVAVFLLFMNIIYCLGLLFRVFADVVWPDNHGIQRIPHKRRFTNDSFPIDDVSADPWPQQQQRQRRNVAGGRPHRQRQLYDAPNPGSSNQLLPAVPYNPYLKPFYPPQFHNKYQRY